MHLDWLRICTNLPCHTSIHRRPNPILAPAYFISLCLQPQVKKKKNPRGLAWVAPPRPPRPLQLLPLSPNSYRIWHHHFVPNYFICFTTLISEELIFGWKWKQKKKIIIAVPSIHITSDSLQQSMHVLYV